MTEGNTTGGVLTSPDSWEKLAAGNDLPGAIVEYVRQYDWVTFIELQRKMGAHFNVNGDITIAIAADHPNVILWGGMSTVFAETIDTLLRKKRVHIHPAQYLTYFIDGGTMDMPIAKRIPAGSDYKTPHWLPICLRPVPLVPSGREAKRGKRRRR